MPDYMPPFTTMINLANGVIPKAVLVQKRYLHDLEGLFADSAAEDALIPKNPLRKASSGTRPRRFIRARWGMNTSLPRDIFMPLVTVPSCTWVWQAKGICF